MFHRLIPFVLVAAALAAAPASSLAAQAPDEEQARRQLESGRSFMRQGNYTEAIRDFRVVADTYAATSVADNALLEIARYYFDIAPDLKEAATAVESILKRYPTSDSAPDAYVLTGRLAMARSHAPGDLDTALANFDRVPRLFPQASAVPQALVLAGEVHWLAGRYDDAMASLVRVEVDHPNNPFTAQAHLQAARVFVSRGDPVSAMEALQRIRNRWPDSPEAATALERLTLLHRLYVRAKSGPLYAATDENPGPPRLQNVVGMVSTSSGAILWAAENSAGALTGDKAPAIPSGLRYRGLTLDSDGRPVAISATGLRPFGGEPISLQVLRSNGQPQVLEKIDGAVQLYNGDWLAMDDDLRVIHRFNRLGEHQAQFGVSRVTRMAINAFDEVAAIDRDQRGIVVLDGSGAILGRIPAKGAGYDLPNIEAVAFDAFGHVYVLDRGSLAVFSHFGGAAKPRTYTLLSVFSEPQTMPNAFRRATSFALDGAGTLYLYDDRAERVRVYR
jgi:outer membrane protein assembly factor BamD (BamD/ComL family)